MKFQRLLVFIATGFLLAGCATTTPVDSRARALCVQTFSTDAYFKVLWIPFNPVEGFSTTFLGNTSPQLEVASAMEAARDKRVDLVVWSEARSDSTTAIERSLRYIRSEKHPLDRLNFLFVGDASEAERLRPSIEATGAKFYFHQR